MEILPLCADSLGTRSMATFVKTEDITIIIDPAVSLAPRRYGLPPHTIEIEKLEADWKKISDFSRKADVVIITHYHYDHHSPKRNLEIYDGKFVFIKHPTDHINFSQRKRASIFQKAIQDLAEEIIFADNREFVFGNTRIRFSPPVPHGENSKLGYVIQVLIEENNQRFLFTSDVEGPILEDQVNFILNMKPNYVLLDGPMTYMLGYRYSTQSLNMAIKNIERIISMKSLKKLIIDHHFMRDINWEERIMPLIRYRNTLIQSSAEFLGLENNLLEARRKYLWYGNKEKL